MAYTCFQTEIMNVASGQIVASMFGKTLAVGETLTVPGDVSGYLVGKFPGIKGRRMIQKLHDLIDAGVLSITAIPTATCGQAWDSSSSTYV